MLFFSGFVIASAVILLAWLTVTLTEEKRKKEIKKEKSEDRRFVRFTFSDSPVWYFSDALQQS